MKRGKKKKYYSWDIDPIVAEMERLEMQMLLHESEEAFRMLMQRERETPPEAPDCEKEAE